MESLQRTIEDEKKARLPVSHMYTGVGSLACGLTNSTYGWPLAEAETRRHGFFHIHCGEMFAQGAPCGELFAHGLPQLLAMNYDALIEDVASRAEAKKRGSSPGVVTGRSFSGGFRQRELEWRLTHATELRQYENQWVVLEGEEIIAHNSDAAEAIRQAKSRGIRTPYIFFVESASENVVRIGL
jgi:hypothetical protein